MAIITIIDDAVADAAIMQSILHAAQHSVTVYNDSQGVEHKIAANPPSLILLDIVMPERNGYEVLRALKRGDTTKHIPVILVSSKKEDTDIRWGKRQGAADYVTKPYQAEELLNTIQNFI